jgi:GNAT superfamily N-acetyltransferase
VGYYSGEKAGIERATARLFPRRLSAWEYAELAGAPHDAQVDVGTLGAGLYLETYQPATGSYHAVQLVRRTGGETVVVIDAIRVHESMRRRGLGLRIFVRQLAAATDLGVARIETVAGRNGHENGYYTWPRFGFDGPLPARIKRKLPLGLVRAQTVLDLIECPAGRRWWRDHGVPVRLAFDVAYRSRSWALLERYLRTRI